MTITANPSKTVQDLRSEIATLVEEFAALTYAPRSFVPGTSTVPVSGKVMGSKELQLMVEASLDG